MILRVTDFRISGPQQVWLSFNDGSEGEADLSTTLTRGTVFEPLLDPERFAEAELDPIAGTIVWPNGADFAPEALHELLSSIPASA